MSENESESEIARELIDSVRELTLALQELSSVVMHVGVGMAEEEDDETATL